jgi:hypothetical protein
MNFKFRHERRNEQINAGELQGQAGNNKKESIMKRTAIIAAIVAAAWIFNATAADEQESLKGPSNIKRLGADQGQGGAGREGGQRPPPPILRVLDANGDKIIDADEIANAPAALKKLDKNGDGKLTPDEVMPPRPQRPDGEQGGQGGGNREGQQGNSNRSGPPPQDGPNNQ